METNCGFSLFDELGKNLLNIVLELKLFQQIKIKFINYQYIKVNKNNNLKVLSEKWDYVDKYRTNKSKVEFEKWEKRWEMWWID